MKRSPEIEAVIHRVWDSVMSRDLETFRNLFSRDPDIRLIASGAEEWWAGYDLVVGIFDKRIAELGAVRMEFHRLEAFEAGAVGWAAADTTFFTQSGDSFPLTFTVTLQLEAGAWRVVQWHGSGSIPNVDAWGFELTTTLGGLVLSLDDAATNRVVSSSSGGTVTIMFTDIENSTQMSERSGDEAWSETIRTHLAGLQRIVEEAGGTVVKTLGDGAMMAFAAARGAVEAAIKIQQALRSSKLRVRIGLHTGDALHVAEDYIGLTVSKAARVASAASGGEILVSSITAELVAGSGVHFGTGQEVELKGINGTHRLIPILWDS